MKLKQQPEDFRVEEITSARPTERGSFSFYRLNKTGWTTPDAIQLVCRTWQIPWRAVSYGGLKDRHAQTTQYLTIDHGPRKNFEAERLKLTFLGPRDDRYTSHDIQANRFVIVLRSLDQAVVDRVLSAMAIVREAGVVNYFDDQRFGSVTSDGRFIGRELVAGRYEVGLKMALAEPYEFDRADARREKEILREHWGDWPKCKSLLPRGHARSIVDYMVHHPTDFRGAIARLRLEWQGLYLSAFQSELWNLTLARWIEARFAATPQTRVTMHRHSLPMPDAKDETWLQSALPLPCPRMKPPEVAEWLPHMEAVLAAEGLTYKKLKLPGLNKPYFSKGDRAVAIRPEQLASETRDDELNQGRKKVTLSFDLPRGSYATMVIKRLTSDSPPVV